MKVLIVDDMEVMRKIIRKNLTALGYNNLIEANDGLPAWELLNECKVKGEPVDLVLSDWNMPNMTGLELLKKVRGDEHFKTLPFLLVTAEGEKSNIVEATNAGANSFIAKPFDAETFKRTLTAILPKAS